jgi:hypothetical protein
MDKNYAYISIVGTGDASLLTEQLQLQPTRTWNIGDARKSGGSYPASTWSFESPEFEKPFIHEALAAVVSFIEVHGLNLSSLPADFEAHIQCVGYHEQSSPGFHISKNLLAKLAALGLELDFDLYCHAE